MTLQTNRRIVRHTHTQKKQKKTPLGSNEKLTGWVISQLLVVTVGDCQQNGTKSPWDYHMVGKLYELGY